MMGVGVPVKETTTGERMGLYKKGMTNPTKSSYNPLTAEYKVDQRDVQNDSMLEQYNNDPDYVRKSNKQHLSAKINDRNVGQKKQAVVR